MEFVEREAISFCNARICCSRTLVLASISKSAFATASLPASYMSSASRMSIHPHAIGIGPKVLVFYTAALSYNRLHQRCPPKNEGPATPGERLHIFYRLVVRVGTVQSDFHGWVTAMFDGTALTMPDMESNQEKFGKPGSGRGAGAFPQMRVVALMIMSVRQIYDIAYAPYKGKKTGERTLMFEILERCKVKNLLILFDAGFYSFFLLPGT